MKFVAAAAALFAATAASAQSVSPAVIRVVGNGSVKTAPDVAVLSFALRGEGATSDDAVRALVFKRGPIDEALAGNAEVRTGRLSVTAARDKACDAGDDDYNDKTRLSTGPCAIKGYVAYLAMTARVKPVSEGGTLLALIGRLGAVDPSLGDFAMTDRGMAYARAAAGAVEDARRQAGAIAASSGVKLGRLRRVEDARAQSNELDEVIVTGQLRSAYAASPPIVVALSPTPIETTATLTVEFEIAGPTP